MWQKRRLILLDTVQLEYKRKRAHPSRITQIVLFFSALELPSISKSFPEHALSALVKYRNWQEDRRLSEAFLSLKAFWPDRAWCLKKRGWVSLNRKTFFLYGENYVKAKQKATVYWLFATDRENFKPQEFCIKILHRNHSSKVEPGFTASKLSWSNFKMDYRMFYIYIYINSNVEFWNVIGQGEMIDSFSRPAQLWRNDCTNVLTFL